MILEIYVVGKHSASFDPVPGAKKRYLVVPGGSEVLETMADGRSFRVLFVPTRDPLQRRGWSASGIVKSIRSGLSPFRLVPRRKLSAAR